MREKSVNFIVRTVLRIMAWGVLTTYMIWKIIKPIIEEQDVNLTTMDVKIIISCLVLLLSIEAVKALFDWRLKKQQNAS